MGFQYTVPAGATGTVTFTVLEDKAKAQSATEGPNNELDGNQNHASGKAPNRTNYVWTASCNTVTVHFTSSGSESETDTNFYFGQQGYVNIQESVTWNDTYTQQYQPQLSGGVTYWNLVGNPSETYTETGKVTWSDDSDDPAVDCTGSV